MTQDHAPSQAPGEAPLVDVIASMTWASLSACALPPRELMVARLAALAAVGAPPLSYVANTEILRDAGLTVEDVQAVLIAVAPIVGTAHAITAAGAIAEALGFEISATEARFREQLGD